MPGSTTTKKNLYIAKNLTELNAKADGSIKISPGQCRMFVKSSDKVYKNAEESQLLGDEERAYVLYMKFLNIVQAVRKSPEYIKNKKFYDDMIGAGRLVNALQHAENLSGGLKERYEEQEAKEVSARLQALDEKESEKTQEEEVVETTETEDPVNNTEPPVEEPGGLLTCQRMYNLMNDDSSSLLIMDIRSQDQYLASHIKYHHCLNIPKDIIQAGCTVRHIEAGLPSETWDVWAKRGSVDFVVLLDWSCGEKDLTTGTPLCSLKDAIYKWDQDVVIKSEPFILDGGYEEWLNYYPTWTTNALIPRPPSYSQVSSTTMSLDKIDYDLDFLKTPEQKAAEKKHILEQIEQNSKMTGEIQLPVIPDRTKKPTTGPMPNNMVSPNNSVAQIVEKSIERINNDLNNPNNSSNKNSQGVWKTMGINKPGIGSQVKENNLLNEKQVRENEKPPEPVIPDRTLKPSAKSKNVDKTEPVPSVVSSTGEVKAKDSEEKEVKKPSVTVAEQDNRMELERERQRIVLETEARKAKLEAEKKQIEKLKQLKTKEAEETAALMRKKREVEEQLHQLELEKQSKEKEERLRQEAKMRKLDEDQTKQAEVAALREKRKMQEAEAEAEKERLAQEDLKKQEAEKAQEEQRKEEVARQEQLQREEKERKAQEKKLLEEQRRLEEAEKIKKEEMERKIKEEERKLAEMKRRQEEEEKKAQEEREEQEKRQKKEAERREKERQAAETGGSQLTTGWEKRYDKSKGMYYYINHDTKTTQWEPPNVQTGRSSPQVVHKAASPQVTPKGVTAQVTPKAASPQRKLAPAGKGERYTVKLKEEGEQTSMGGLKRSHSSPNIAKLMENEGDQPIQQHPSVNRIQKPKTFSTSTPRPDIKELQRPQVFSEAKVRNFTPIWGSVGHGLAGLRNQGNTCYMNSTLQCMSNTGFLTTYLITENYRHDINVHNKFGTRGEIAEEYCALVKAMWSGQYKSVTPRDFKMSCARHCSTFAGYDQQDSQEFLSYLLDWLHEDLNKIRNRVKLPDQENDGVADEVAAERAWKLHKTVHDSIIVDLFQGQFKSSVMCKTCEKKSVTFDTFMYLSLELPSKSRCSLRDCLINFSQEEQMTGDSRWNCPKCKVKRNAVKRIVIWKLPPILIIVLKRFCQTGMWRQKNSAYVDFPTENVDFHKFVSGPQQRKLFSLFAVSNHYGTMDGGHYTAFCKNPKLNRWYKFDDHEVYEYSQSDVKSAAAYFLFYTSIGQM